MTDTATPTTGAAPVDRRRNVGLLVAAAVLVVAVVSLVLVFGVVRAPQLARLADEPAPAPSGGVAWTTWSDGTCVMVARPDGSVERLDCVPESADILGWTEEGIVLRVYRGREELVTLDPASGDVVAREQVEGPSEAQVPEGVRSSRDGGRLVVTRELDDTVLWTVEVADAYTVDTGALSPDRGWIAMTDSAERLLLVPADGSLPPRLWAEGAPRWQQLVWEGQPPA